MFGICLPNYYICNRNEKKIKQVNINLTIFKEMNKKLFFLAIAALGLAACSNDDVVEINQSLSDANAISFRSNVEGQTRATATVLSTIESSGFYVGAWNNSDHSSYFADVQFTKDADATTYHSAKKYFWPATGNLDFVAYYPNIGGQLTHVAWNTFTLEPASTISSHVDYIIAATINQSKANSASGVPLAFKHLGSWIELKAYNQKGNTAGNLKTSVTGWKIGYLYNGGVYTVTSSTANGSALSLTGSWSYANYAQFNAETNKPTEYSETISAVTTTTDASCDESSEAATIGNAMIIVPQTTAKITGSSTYGTGGYVTGAFIAVKLSITDGSDHVLADATGDNMWAIWPISNNWLDGYKYTYVIDLSQGGFKEMGTAGETLKPWLQGSEIFFSSVTVTDWGTGEATVENP